MPRLGPRFRALGRRSHADESAGEAFTRDLFTGRLSRPAVAIGLVAIAVAVAWTWNAVSPAAGLAAGAAVVLVVLAAVVMLDRLRWRGQDVVVWQQAGRTRRWQEDTGGPSPSQHPAQAETWLGTHPRGSVPQLYRVLAASAAGDAVIRDRELAAFVPATPAEEAWRAWAAVSRRVLDGEDVDLTAVRTATKALPDGDDRRQLEAGLAVTDALRRHRTGQRAWLEPLLDAYPRVSREAVPVRQTLRLWFGRLAILLSFVIPAAGLAASGIGTPDPFPRAYLDTTFATRGDIGTIDQRALLNAMSPLAHEVAAHDGTVGSPIGVDEVDALIARGLPTLIWHVDAISIPGPSGIGCDHATSIETLLGSVRRGTAIVTCRSMPGVAFVVPVTGATVTALRTALGVDR